MAFHSVSNWRQTATAKPTEAGESVRRTYLWERNEKGEKVLRLDQTIDQQAEIDSYLEETKLENIIRRASIDPDLAARLADQRDDDRYFGRADKLPRVVRAYQRRGSRV